MTEPLAILKYLGLKFGSDSTVGDTLAEKAEVEMFSHMLVDLLK